VPYFVASAWFCTEDDFEALGTCNFDYISIARDPELPTIQGSAATY